MRHRTTSAAVLLALLVLAAGCADADPRASGTDTGRATSADPPPDPTSDSTPDSMSSTAPVAPPTTPPSEGLQKIRVVGEVVEAGDCVVVEDHNAMTWTITGEGSDVLELGDQAQVTGTPDLRALGCGGPVVQATRIVIE